MSQKPQGFFDSKTLLAIVLTTIVWIGWQAHLQRKYPNSQKAAVAAKQQEEKATQAQVTDSSPKPAETEGATKVNSIELGNTEPFVEKTLKVDGDNWAFEISSQGMGVKDLSLKNFKTREGSPITLGHKTEGILPFETRSIGRTAPLEFAIEKVSDNHFVGRAQSQGVQITKTMILDESKYRIDSEVQISGAGQGFIGLTTYMVDPFMQFEGGTAFTPSFERQELYALGQETSHRIHLAAEKDQEVKLDKLQVAALGTQYFTQALVDHSEVMGELKAQANWQKKSVVMGVNHSLLNPGQELKLKYTAFLGPKDMQILTSVDQALVGVVDFGFFAVLGRPILRMLKWFHSVVGNWGIAIILLTIVVRFLVLPFNVMSFRSMKAMQLIQPQIQKLKERHKDDPTRMNQEMLALFKDNKVNPLGGCFPVLLQIPVFFALYQVLGHSVELYQAPFMLWIHDLSHKDPFFVLPVLMGITMFIQMKITPSSADPMQAKILMAMPLIMTVFMLTLPSGLTLYIFVSTLFGIFQQLYLMKTNTVTLVTNTK